MWSETCDKVTSKYRPKYEATVKQVQGKINAHLKQKSTTVAKHPRNWRWLINALVHITHQDGENQQWFTADKIVNVLKKYHKPNKTGFVVNYMATLKKYEWVGDRMFSVSREHTNHGSKREYCFFIENALDEIDCLSSSEDATENRTSLAHA